MKPLEVLYLLVLLALSKAEIKMGRQAAQQGTAPDHFRSARSSLHSINRSTAARGLVAGVKDVELTDMNWKQKIQLALWALLSICISAFFSFISSVFLWLRTMDLHKNTSGPGDFAEADASIILTDILVNWGIIFIFIIVIAWGGYEITKGLTKDFSTPFNRRQVSKFLYTLFVFNLLLLCAGPLYSGMAYWQQRAPYFPK